MHALLLPGVYGDLPWLTYTPRYAKLLAPIVHYWCSASVAAQSFGEVRESTVYRVLAALHRAKIFTVSALQADVGWRFKSYHTLTLAVQESVTRQHHKAT